MFFPISPPTESEMLLDFNNLLTFNEKLLIQNKKWFSRSDYTFEQSNFYIKANNIGSESSNYFHFWARMNCDSLNSPSPVRSWFDPKIRKSVESSKFFEKSPKTAIALRKYIASQFRPSAAKCLYNAFKAKNIYDPCGGWGDRLFGFVASNAESYLLRDVNPLLFLGYESQDKFCKNNGIQKNIKYELKGSEIDKPEFEADFVFTSPPYFIIELYQGKDSSHYYRKFNDWLNKFLYPMLQNSWDILKDNGIIAINISDVYAQHNYNQLCQPTYEYLFKQSGANYLGTIGYEMRKRLNSKSNQEGIFCEPIIIFQKNGNNKLEDFLKIT